jgi:hypothetical protein
MRFVGRLVPLEGEYAVLTVLLLLREYGDDPWLLRRLFARLSLVDDPKSHDNKPIVLLRK